MTKLQTLRMISWSLIILVIIITGAVLGYQTLHRDDERTLVSQLDFGAPFSLIDHNGEPISEAAFADKPIALFFGFTHCPEICPTSLYELSAWLNRLGEEGDEIGAFFVTVDPERDTPELMKNYVEAFTDRIVGITGPKNAIEEMARAWRVYFRRVPLDDGDYTMDHTASIFLVDRNGKFFGTISYGESAETAVGKLQRLANS